MMTSRAHASMQHVTKPRSAPLQPLHGAEVPSKR